MPIDNQTNPLYESPLETYKYFLLGPMLKIYSSRSKKTDWERHANLLIDKFAIHSSTLFHVMQGMIEHKSSTQNQRKMAYDMFSVNTLIRVLIETYITFHHIFVLPTDIEEMQLRFRLWQLDGLLEKRKFNIETTSLPETEPILKQDKERIDNLCVEIEQDNFFNKIPLSERSKIYNRKDGKPKVVWKFNISKSFEIRPLKIIELVEQTCRQNAFVNTYKYASVHTHSGYLAIEHFEKMRGKEISTQYTDPFIRLVTYLTTLMIKDMCDTDRDAQNEFGKMPIEEQNFINGIVRAIRCS